MLASLLFFCFLLNGIGQTSTYTSNKNVLSPEDFYNISFNGVTLGKIIDTQGVPAEINSLFGKTIPFSKSDNPDYYRIGFKADSIYVNFSELSTSPADLSSLYTINKSVVIKIGTTTFHIGDPISKLGNIHVYTQPNGNQTVIFLPDQTDGIWLSVEFDQTTKLITKVEYMTI